MKRNLFLGFSLVLIVLLAIAPVEAQPNNTVLSTTITPVSGGIIGIWSDSVQTTATDTSNHFLVAGYFREPLSTYPLHVQYSIGPNPVAGVDSCRISLETSYDHVNWVPLDTLANNSGTAALAETTIDCNGEMGPYLRWKTIGLGSNTTAVFIVRWWLQRIP